MPFSENLKRIRESLNLSRQELAVRAGISLSYVQHLEAERRKPSWKVIERLAAALGVKPDALIDPPPAYATDYEIFADPAEAAQALTAEISALRSTIERVVEKVKTWKVREDADDDEAEYDVTDLYFDDEVLVNEIERIIMLVAELAARLHVDRAREVRSICAYLPFAPLRALTAAREVIEASVLLSIDRRVLLPTPDLDPAATRRARGIE